MRLAPSLVRLQELELGLCLRLSQAQRRRRALQFFRAVSKAGDGLFWFVLAGLLPLLLGAAALPTVRRMAAVGIAAALVSKALKALTGRSRPFRAHAGFCLGAAPLDRYSFPSGHTLHAVAFSIVVLATHGSSPGFSCPSPSPSPCRASCSGCTIRPMSRQARRSAPSSPLSTLALL